jgi:hypothetical protein
MSKNSTLDVKSTKFVVEEKQKINLHPPWVEKYRPKLLSHMIGNKFSIEKFKSLTKQGNIPNLIITVSLFFLSLLFLL